jgi:hypothetical protein
VGVRTRPERRPPRRLLFSTYPDLTPEAIVGPYTGLWNFETTFEEFCARLGPGTTRGWCRRTVLGAAPCLFGRHTAVFLLFGALPEKRSGSVAWSGKAGVTFSDAVASLRCWLWAERVLLQAEGGAVENLLGPLREIILSALAPDE